MNASFGVRFALHPDRLARTFARPGIGLGALTPHRETADVADPTIALDALQALEVHAEFAAQVTFDHVLAILNRVNDLRKLRFGQILGPDGSVNVRAFENLERIDRPDAIDVTERNINALVRWYFNPNDACHKLTLTLFVTLVRADDTNNATATHNLAVLAQLFNRRSNFHA